MDRPRAALVLLLLFAACTAAAIVISGSRPGSQQGVAPSVVQSVGSILALVAGLLLLSAGVRGIAATVLAGVALLQVAEAVSRGGTDIGAGGVRLVGLVVVAIATVRLARGVAAARRTP